jgi:3-phenylpropionate/trans-cinnamate dioxygenase ferredoxin subunit
MGSFTKVANTDELQDGSMKKVSLEGKEILLAKSGGSFYAADNRCPHFNGDLSKGTLTGTVVTCPLHHSQFDLRDGGRVVRWTDFTGFKLSAVKLFKGPKPLVMYQVKVEGNGIFIAMKDG